MAWYRSRRVRRRRRYGRVSSRFYRRRRLSYRRRRWSRAPRSSIVKLTYESQYPFITADSTGALLHNAFQFTPNDIPGFSDYFPVYTRFRIARAVLRVSTAPSLTTVDPTQLSQANYLTVPSLPFAQTAIATAAPGSPLSYVPSQSENALRQTRRQRVRYPSKITNQLRVPFRPYCMTSAYGPNTANATTVTWQRAHMASRWMPITWAKTSTASRLTFFGPYIARSTNQSDSATWQAGCTLELYVQFAGQI